MTERNENLYDSLPQRPLLAQISSPQFAPSARPPPLPPPRKSSVPVEGVSSGVQDPDLTQDSNPTLSEYELDDLIDYLETECAPSPERHAHTAKRDSTSTEADSSSLEPHPLSDIEESDSSSPEMKRAGHSQLIGSPVPRPRSQKSSMSRSRSCDHLAEDVVNEKKVSETHRKTTLLPGSGLEDEITAKLVMVDPPILPQNRMSMHSSSSNQSNVPVSHSSSPTAKTLNAIATEMGKSLPMRIEMQEGYMSSTVPAVTFSASDVFNVHLIKQQEVVKVRDSLGQVYSIPYYSSIQIGLVNDSGNDGTAKKGNTLHKTAKAADIMAMKELPKIMCATKSVKSTSGDKFSVEEKELLLVRGVNRVPGSKKKKMVQGLEVYSITKRMEKVLFPDCTGHFSLSPSLTRLPMAALFKNMSGLSKCFPLHAYLFFKPEDFVSSIAIESDCSTIPPSSLSQNLVTIVDKILETALILSPYLDSETLDIRNSENLLHVIMDDKFGPMEVSINEVGDHSEKSKLFNNTCTIHDSIDLSKIKYYHAADSSLVYHTQAYLYGRCQSKKLGVKMDLPMWTDVATTTAEKRKCQPESSHTSSSVIRDDAAKKTKSVVMDHRTGDKMSETKRKSEPLLSINEDSKSSNTFQNITQPHPPSPPTRNVFSPPQSSSHPSSRPSTPTLPSANQSPPHSSQSHAQVPYPSSLHASLQQAQQSKSSASAAAQNLTPPAVPPSQLLSSITQRMTSVKGDGLHRRFSDMDLDSTGGSGSQTKDGESYSPRPDRKVRKSNSVKDTSLHVVVNRPPYPIPSDSTAGFRTPGRESKSVYRSPRSIISSPTLVTAPGLDGKGSHATHSSSNTFPRATTPTRTPPNCPPIPPRDTRTSPNPPSRPIPARITRDSYENRYFGGPRSVPTGGIPPSSSHLQSLTAHPTSETLPYSSSNPYSLEAPKPRRQAPDIPLPKIPPPVSSQSQVDDDDDLGVYEEMKSIRLPPMAAPKQPPRRVNNSQDDSDDYEGIDPKMLKPPRHGSAGYEIFNPPVSSHVVQEMDVKIQSLSKELTELRASCAASAAKIDSLEEKLRLTNEQMQTLTRRESGSGSEQPGSSGVDRETERNRVLVQSLTCKELKLVLEGLSIGQYCSTINQEQVDGRIFVMLDESTLQNELGVVSKLHRLKMLNLIRGSYNPRAFIKDSNSQQTTC